MRYTLISGIHANLPALEVRTALAVSIRWTGHLLALWR